MADDDELAAHAQSRIGKVLREKYRIESVIGIGGMASVYAASHRNGRRVALKLLHPELSIRTDLRKRFLREAHAANAVKHPGVVAVIDDDVAEDGAAFLVMELLEGESVEELWEAHGRKLSVKTVLSIACDLCEVLAVAHEAGVVHRDLKPANLFVTHEGELKVLDFGIARVRDEAGPRATQTGSVLGTPAFMAPEQAGGLINDVGPLTDIWAVGATMFTLLTGRSVHDGQSAQHIAVLAATKPAPSLASVILDAPPELVTVVDRALAFEKSNRWTSAVEMGAALSEAVSTLTEKATPMGSGLSETRIAVVGVKPIRRSGTLVSRGNSAAPSLLGATTGQPVSSSSITTVGPRPAARTILLHWQRGRAAFRDWSLRLRRVVAGTDLVSSDAPTRRRFSSRARALSAVIVVAAVAATGGTVVAFRDRGADKVAPGLPAHESAQESSSIATGTPDATTGDDGASMVVPPVVLPEASFRPVASASLRGAKGATSRPRPAPASAPRLNCTPPFTIQDGIQVHKPGCP